MSISIYNPDRLGAPLGQYSQISRIKSSELVFIAGQVSTNGAGEIVGVDDFDAQCAQVFANIEGALRSQSLDWGNVAQFTTYLISSQDIPLLMKFRERVFPKLFNGSPYPPNTLLMVDRLVKEQFLIEVQTIAAA